MTVGKSSFARTHQHVLDFDYGEHRNLYGRFNIGSAVPQCVKDDYIDALEVAAPHFEHVLVNDPFVLRDTGLKYTMVLPSYDIEECVTRLIKRKQKQFAGIFERNYTKWISEWETEAKRAGMEVIFAADLKFLEDKNANN